MTSGTRISDGQSVAPAGLDCGSGQFIGPWTSKTWTGADSPDPNKRTENAYSMSASKTDRRIIQYAHWYTGWNVIKTATLPGCFAVPAYRTTNWSSNDDIVLANKAIHKIRTHELDLGKMLGEHHQTLTLIGDSATKIYKMVKSLKHGDFRGAARALNITASKHTRSVNVHVRYPKSGPLVSSKQVSTASWKEKRNLLPNSQEIADNFLELQYGWRPLLSDVYAAGEAMASELYGKPVVDCYRTSRVRSNEGTDITGSDIKFFMQTYKKVSLKIYYKQTETLPQRIGLENPLSVLWEVTPWSFVVDWFLPIGPYLDALGALRTMKFQNVVTSTLIRKKAVYRGTDTRYRRIYSGADGLELEESTFTRTVGGSTFFLPLPTVKPISEALSFEHAANGIALLVGVKNRFKF